MTNKKVFWTIIAILLILTSFWWTINKEEPAQKEKKDVTAKVAELKNDYLIDGFPLETTPLYKLKKIGSSKIFVNTDPKNTSVFGDKNFAYYNVVLETEASQLEFLEYYKNLFESQIVEEYPSADTVKGKIKQYRVTATHYGDGNTAYIQVHLENHLDEKLNTYFEGFPPTIEGGEYLTEYEKSYGLLNQKGGEVEYTKYFAVTDTGDSNKDGKDDVDEFLQLENKYKEQYKNKSDYSYDEKTGLMKWRDGEYEATLAITRGHGRLYLTLRKLFNK